MTDFLNALKADLLDRRLLPLVALAVVACVGAIGYAVLSGGSSASTPAGAPGVATAPVAAGISATQTTPEKALAEVTSGTGQRRGTAHNPFTLLPEAAAAAAAAKKASTASSTSGTSAAGTSSGSTGSEPAKSGSGTTTEKSTPQAPSKPSKPKPVYHVAILFGVLPPGTTPEGAS
ncbi:MAG TPA: hypothetical protein VHT29_15530, partial [Solirubrobacteraceae bacterium]|nr:hypothetical protein [Solirubrobacteraceae bacterium]